MKTSEYTDLEKALAHHHDTLKGQPDQQRQHDQYGCAATFECAHRRFVKDLDTLRPQVLQTFLAWSAPFFGTSEIGVEAATRAFVQCEAGRTLATLSESPSGSGYIAKIHVLNGKIRDLETLRATVERVKKAVIVL